MSIESATYVNDLQSTNPPSSDPRSQGDDHLRLIKTVLQNQFPRASRGRPIEGTGAINGPATQSFVRNDDQTTFYITTAGGAVTLNLPTLAGGDAGWMVTVYKYSSDANPIFIVPPSGSLFSGGLSITKARRCIPGLPFTIVWNGGSFFVNRTCTLPIGSMIAFAGSSLPAGYEWPNGQTLASASTNYPEYNAVMGSGATLDLRGRVAVTLDNLGGSAAGRLAGGVITGTTVGNVGGVDTVTLGTTQIPNLSLNGTFGVTVSPNGGFNVPGTAGSISGQRYNNGTGPVGNNFPTSTSGGVGDWASVGFNGSVTINGTVNSGGGNSHSNLQPSIMCSKILVVE